MHLVFSIEMVTIIKMLKNLLLKFCQNTVGYEAVKGLTYMTRFYF